MLGWYPTKGLVAERRCADTARDQTPRPVPADDRLCGAVCVSCDDAGAAASPRVQIQMHMHMHLSLIHI